MIAQSRISTWPADRLAEARAVIGDVARHSDHLIRLACNVLIAHGETATERKDGLRPSHHAPISRPLWASMIASHGRLISRRILKARARRRLNPLFVGWLMGWPIGHALCACSATEFTLWQQRMRGALSRLPMASGPWICCPAEEPEGPAQMNLFEGLLP